jgi:hypothetical protein
MRGGVIEGAGAAAAGGGGGVGRGLRATTQTPRDPGFIEMIFL